MRDARVCTACLVTDVRMYSMSATSLLEPYRLLTGIELESEGMPQKLCWECAALVHKFNMFRRKCERASLLLQDIYNQHDEVSEQDVLRVNREQHNLISSYSICSIEVHNLSALNTKGKICHKDETSQIKKIINKQIKNVSIEPFVKLEEIPIEVMSEADDTELIDDVSTEEDCSQAAQLESPQKIKHIRKRKQGLKMYEKPKVLAKDFGMMEELLSKEQQMEVMRERQSTEGYRTARFPCTLCYNPFNEEKTFNNHKIKHEPISGEFVCDICKLRYKKKHMLRRHVSTQHMYKYSCRSCPDVFYNRFVAMKHYDWHKGVVYTCPVCEATFDKQTTHANHLRIKHPTGHVCDQCAEPFHSKKGLLQHIKLMHKLKRDTAASGGDHETRGPYCAECDIQFTCKQAWTRHVLISPKHQHERHICALGCKRCGKTLPDEESLRAHRAIHRYVQTRKYGRPMINDTPITCEQCDEVMESSRKYNAHFRSAHPDKTRTQYPAMLAPLMCELCGKIFQSKTHLKQHSYTHTEERRYKCELCSKRFMTKQVLGYHISTHSENTKPYKCDICGEGFSKYGNISRHMAVHSDAMPYACEICGKSFKYRGNMKSHIEYVHMKKPWPKRGSSNRYIGNERRSRDHKLELLDQA